MKHYKRLIIIFFTLFILMASSISFVFASTLPDIPVISNPGADSSTFEQARRFAYGTTTEQAIYSLSSDDLGIALVGSRFYFFTHNQFSSYRIIQYVSSSNTYSLINNGNNQISNPVSGYDFYCAYYNLSLPNADPSIPVFSTLEEAASAYNTAENVGEVFDFTIDPGMALVIQGPCEIDTRVFSVSGSWDFISNGEKRVNGSVERLLSISQIVDGFSPDKYLSSDDLVQWNALNENAQGVASNYSFSAIDVISVPSGSCFILTNPGYYGVQGVLDNTFTYKNNSSISAQYYITYTSRPTIKQVAIKTVEEWVNRQYYMYNTFQPSIYYSTGEDSVGTDSTIVTFTGVPLDGGNYGTPVLDGDTSLLGVIRSFVNNIKSLFNTANEAISSLVSDGASFMQSIGTMFTWLPAPLTSLIIAGLTVLLVVGVVRFLWH